MSLLAQKKRGFTIPEGAYQGILVGVYDLGTQTSEKYQNEAQKVAFIWELPEVDTAFDAPVTLCKIYTNSLHEKATLRSHVEAILGRSLSDSEAEKGVELNQLLGANAQLYVVQTESNGRTRMNIRNVTPLMPKTKKLKSYSEHVYYELNPAQDIPPVTPKWIESLIMKSKEWEAGVSDEEEPPSEETLKEPF